MATLAEMQMLLAFRAHAALQFPAQVTPSPWRTRTGLSPEA